MMTALLSVAGTALILIVLRDIFHTLFNPSSSGSISNQVIQAIWRIVRGIARNHRPLLSSAGPLALVVVISTWTVGLVIGWALIVWPRLPDDFLYATGLDPANNSGFWDAIYLSMVTISTLGYGNITPVTTGLRLIEPLQALVGFALVTAAISWILSVYPVLARRRNLARQVTLLHRTGEWESLIAQGGSADALNTLLMDLAGQVIFVRNDYLQFPVTYYFTQTDDDAALELALPHIARMAEQTRHHDSPSVRFQAAHLEEATRDLASYLGTTFLGLEDASPANIFTTHARDHLRDPVPSAEDTGHSRKR